MKIQTFFLFLFSRTSWFATPWSCILNLSLGDAVCVCQLCYDDLEDKKKKELSASQTVVSFLFARISNTWIESCWEEIMDH